MAATIKYMGLDCYRDSSGQWRLKGSNEVIQPTIAAQLDLYARQMDQAQARNLAAFKPSPRVPALWDGPMPQDIPASLVRNYATIAATAADFFTFNVPDNGEILIKEYSLTISGPNNLAVRPASIWLNLVEGDGSNNSVIFSGDTTNDFMARINLIHRGPVTVRLVNGLAGNANVKLALTAWIRTPPLSMIKPPWGLDHAERE